MKLTSDQIAQACELANLSFTDELSDWHVEMALNLYQSLHNKPKFICGNYNIEATPEERAAGLTCFEFFNNSFRIDFLAQWTLKIVPFVDLLEGVGKLPLQRNHEDYLTFVQTTFHHYLTELDEIYEAIPDEHQFITSYHTEFARDLCESIISTIEQFLKGQTSEAFHTLKCAIEQNLVRNRYLVKLKENAIPVYLYKMRLGSNHPYISDEMFHIPFELRGLVATNRYSIPGLPCVYLGSTALTCWEELGKPDLNMVQTALFKLKDLNYLDLSLPPGAVTKIIQNRFNMVGGDLYHMNEYNEDLNSYTVLWPLIAACSIRVQNPGHAFKPEYIVPQLLLQWIRQSDFDGICYFSTKVDDYDLIKSQMYKNFAFPVQDQRPVGHCNVLRSKFTITDAITWQTFQMYKNSKKHIPSNSPEEWKVEFVSGIKLQYDETEFAGLEDLLISSYQNSQLQAQQQPMLV